MSAHDQTHGEQLSQRRARVADYAKLLGLDELDALVAVAEGLAVGREWVLIDLQLAVRLQRRSAR